MIKKPVKVQEEADLNVLFLELPTEFVAEEALKWSGAAWWPAATPIRWVKMTQGDVQVGTQYAVKVALPLIPPAVVEVSRLIPNVLVEYTYKSGMFVGREIIRVEERANGTRVEVERRYTVPKLTLKIAWMVLLRQPYNQGIKKTLDVFKVHITDKYKAEQEKKFEGKS